jgi:hypothetical protein
MKLTMTREQGLWSGELIMEAVRGWWGGIRRTDWRPTRRVPCAVLERHVWVDAVFVFKPFDEDES